MKNEMFDELLSSVHEMDEIIRGKRTAAKVTEFPDLEVKAVREKTGMMPESIAFGLEVKNGYFSGK